MSISPIQKYHYLRAALSGEASEVIKSLEFVGENYNAAWELLCDRYNNNRLLIYNHVKSLFSLDSLAHENSTLIRKTIDSVYKHLRALQSVGQPTDKWDTLIIYLIQTKLDPATAREWEEFKGEEIPSLDSLKQSLKQRADVLETLENQADKKRPKNVIKSYFSKVLLVVIVLKVTTYKTALTF